MLNNSFQRDEFIWAKCIEGDIFYIEILYRRYYDLLIEYGTNISGNRDVSADLIQTLFTKIITNHKRLSKTKYVKAYLLKSFRNLLINDKKQTKEFTAYEDYAFEDVEYTDSRVLKENVEILEKVYKRLNSKQKEIIYLYFFKELTHDEISVILNINYQSSKNLLHKTIVEARNIFYRYYDYQKS